jgi:hypothetical protein
MNRLQATLRVLPGVTDLLDPTLLEDPVYAKVVPPRLLAWYRTEPAQWFKREMFGPAVDAEALLTRVRTANERWATSDPGRRALRHLYELGQPLLLASDTPSAPIYGNQPGYDTYKEMQLFLRASLGRGHLRLGAVEQGSHRVGRNLPVRHWPDASAAVVREAT